MARLGVSPIKGDWSLMQDHIREVLASGDDDADAYITNWLAFACSTRLSKRKWR